MCVQHCVLNSDMNNCRPWRSGETNKLRYIYQTVECHDGVGSLRYRTVPWPTEGAAEMFNR